MIPLILERREQEIVHNGRKTRHYILHLNMDFKLADLQKMALIDPTKALLELPEVNDEVEDIKATQELPMPTDETFEKKLTNEEIMDTGVKGDVEEDEGIEDPFKNIDNSNIAKENFIKKNEILQKELLSLTPTELREKIRGIILEKTKNDVEIARNEIARFSGVKSVSLIREESLLEIYNRITKEYEIKEVVTAYENQPK